MGYTITKLVSISLLMYLVLFYVGHCLLATVSRAFSDAPDHSFFPKAVAGIVSIQIAGYYFLKYGSIGIANLSWIVVLVASLLTVLVAKKDFRKICREMACDIKSEFLTIGITIVVFVISWRYLLIREGLTVGSANNDIANYAQFTQFIEHNSFSSPGRIVILHSGQWSESPIPGILIYMGFLKNLTGFGFQSVLLPILCCSLIVISISIKKLLSLTNLNAKLSSVLAASTTASPIIGYLAACYFLPQILTIALLISFLSVIMYSAKHRANERCSLFGFMLLTMIGSSVVSTYPQYAAVFAMFAVWVSFNIRRLRDSLLTAAMAVGAIVVAYMVYLPLAIKAVERFFNLAADSVNGWPMHILTPSHLIGFGWGPNIPVSNADWQISLLILAIFAYSVFSSAGNQDLPVIRIIMFVLVTYGLVVFQTGESYRQFKWASTLAPLFIVAVTLPVAQIFYFNPKLRRGSVFIPTMLISLFSVANMISQDEWLRDEPNKNRVITKDMVDLKENLVLQELDALNIKTGVFSDSMWPAVFLETQLLNILDAAYYSTPQPIERPTLVTNNFQSSSGVGQTKVNSTYNLVHFPEGPNSLKLNGMKSRIDTFPEVSLKTGEVSDFRAIVFNSGMSTWLGSGNFQGAVNLGVRIVGNGSQELSRVSLGDFPNYVAPGEHRTISINLSFDKAGVYTVQLSPVSEGVGWLADSDGSNGFTVQVNVSD